jgi:hypothetical protein
MAPQRTYSATKAVILPLSVVDLFIIKNPKIMLLEKLIREKNCRQASPENCKGKRFQHIECVAKPHQRH